MAMSAKRKRSESKQSSAESAKRNRKSKSTTKTTAAARTSQSVVPLPKVYVGRVVDKEDPYSRLSDEIIMCHILTRLSMREAVRTSVLSRRWRYLWTASIGPKLIFSYPDNHDFCIPYSEIRPILARGISHVLEVVKSIYDELTVSFNFNSPSCYQDVNKWVEIALKNRVTRLHLDFSSSKFDMTSPDHRYTLPAIHSDSVKYPGTRNLTDVCFKYINVSKEVIESMVSNCPSLERLAVWKSRVFDKIRVCTQSTKLKSLEFVCCCYERIEISSPNLISLRYGGVYECLHLQSVPLLSQLVIDTKHSICSFLGLGAPYFIKCFSQLKKLRLDLYTSEMDQTMDYPSEFPKLTQLEELEVRLTLWSFSSHLWVIKLIMAAPSLQKFNFSRKLFYPHGYLDKDNDHYKNLLNAVGQVRHRHLKSIEMLKFSGTSPEMELGQHLVSISPSLEQFVVSQFYKENEEDPTDPKYSPLPKEEYRMQAQQFKKWLPPTAKLLIL